MSPPQNSQFKVKNEILSGKPNGSYYLSVYIRLTPFLLIFCATSNLNKYIPLTEHEFVFLVIADFYNNSFKLGYCISQVINESV